MGLLAPNVRLVSLGVLVQLVILSLSAQLVIKPDALPVTLVSSGVHVLLVVHLSLTVQIAPKMGPHALPVHLDFGLMATHVLLAQPRYPTVSPALMDLLAPNADLVSSGVLAQLAVPLLLNVQLVHKMGQLALPVMLVSTLMATSAVLAA